MSWRREPALCRTEPIALAARTDHPTEPWRKTRAARVTMLDVARAAQVSQAAVSFVLNERADVNIPQEKRERIWAAVAQLG